MSKRSNQKRKERKKKRSRSGARPDAAHASPRSAATATQPTSEEEEHHSALDIPDEYLHAPREVSKLRFALMIGLIIFLLIIFIVPSAMLGVAGGGGDDPVYLRFSTPSGEVVQLQGVDFYEDLRRFSEAFLIDPLAGVPLGAQFGSNELSEKAMARILVLERLAREAGVHVTRQDLAEHIQQVNQTFGRSTEAYLASVQRFGTERIETTLQRALTVGRYLQLLGHVGAIPDPETIAELWHQDHEELAFDYIQLPVEAMKDEARAQLPSDEELEAWLADQPEEVREELKTPERRTAELVFFNDVESTPATGLLEAYPEEVAEGAEPRAPEELAEEYYNRVYYFRFKAAPPEGEDTPAAPQFEPLDEVRDRATAEAPIYFAMQRWLTDLQTRQAAGEEIDLAAEAERLGLERVVLDTPVTREELAEHELFVDDPSKDFLVNGVFQTPEGAFNYATIVTGGRLGVSRVLAIEQRTLPEFAEIRDQVAEQWIEPRAAELAEERLTQLWEGLEEFTPEPEEGEEPVDDGLVHRRADEAAFEALAAGEGMVHGKRDYVDKGGNVNDDPDWEKDPNKFIATHREYFDLEVGEVGAPQASRDGKAWYLVRMAGKREVPIELMSPTQYGSYKTRARSMALGEVSETLDYETLASRYGVWLVSEEEEDEEGEEG